MRRARRRGEWSADPYADRDGNDDGTLFAGYTDLRTLQTYLSRAGSGTLTVSDDGGGRLRGSFQLTPTA